MWTCIGLFQRDHNILSVFQVEGAGGNEACRNFFRRDFLDQWAQSGKRICSTQCSTAAGASATAQDQDTSAPSMTMWSITHKTKTFNAVYARNIQMSDSVAYMGHTVARDTQLPHPEAGSLRIGCEMCDPAALQQAAGKDKYMDVVHRALTPGGNATCEHWVEHPVYFMTRYVYGMQLWHCGVDLHVLWLRLECASVAAVNSASQSEQLCTASHCAHSCLVPSCDLGPLAPCSIWCFWRYSWVHLLSCLERYTVS